VAHPNHRYRKKEKNSDCFILEKPDSVIYAWRCLKIDLSKPPPASPLKITDVVRYVPRHITPRIKAQSGLFSAHPSTTNAPTGRDYHTAIWTGSEMIVWGGTDGNGNYLNSGGRYNPSTNSWTATSTIDVPDGRADHTAVWTGSEMIVWGGSNGGIFPLDTGARYNTGTDSWTVTSTTNPPSARDLHTAVWTGSGMIIWGGSGLGTVLNTGGRYCAQSPTPTPTPCMRCTPTPRPRLTPRARPTPPPHLTLCRLHLRRDLLHGRGPVPRTKLPATAIAITPKIGPPTIGWIKCFGVGADWPEA
jgi:hypothetical protein